MRTIAIFVLGIASVSIGAAAPCSAISGVWNEKNYGSGDAGGLPANADITTGVGQLKTICGDVADSVNGVDMFEILITNPVSFSAVASDRNGSLLEPSLFLFDSSGRALYGDEDGSLSSLSLTSGLYYLAITPEGNDPKHNGNVIFDLGAGLLTPTSGNPKVGGWNMGGDSNGEYKVALTGAAFAQTPEPAAFGLVGIGLIGLVALRRRNVTIVLSKASM